ncbi:MAG: rod shape-determining protein MreD [Actinomycetes bacterium]
MSRSWVRWVAVLATAFVAQVAVFGDLRILGVHPDLLLLVAVVAGLVGGPVRGASVGFAAGVLVDLMLPGRLGTSAVAYALCGFGVGVVGESLIRSARSIVVGLVMAGSAAGVVLYAALAQLLGQGTLSDPHLLQIIGIVSVINGLLCIPVVFVAQWAEDVAPLARYH